MEDSHTVIEGAAGPRARGIVLARGTILAERYEIKRLLGRGGAGVVVQAHDRVLGEDVALKVLLPEHCAEARWVERLAREVKLARQIRHANVCRVFEFGQSDGHAFLVMEIASAGSLRDELRRDGERARPLLARLDDARAVANGLAAIHAAGVLHRDVTTQNVLRMSDGRLVVSDFGLATNDDPTASSIHGGTVSYMAPELARGDHASVASDVWALGIIIHEIVFGRRPSWRDGRFGTAMTADPDCVRGPCERRIVEICQRCTHERLRLRPAASEVSALIANVTEATERPARVRRARLAVGLLALALAVGALATRRQARVQATVAPPTLAISISGQAEDWTTAARVLATVEGRIHALTALPGGKRVRMVWGDPRRIEDVDLASGARVPAVLPRLPDRAGPAVPSPDGSVIAAEGYASGGRPFVFLGASAPSGRLTAVTAAADPSLSSEPRWLANGRAFVFDADVRNVGVFSLDTDRATILPAFDARPSYTTFKAAVFDRVLVARIAEGGTSQIGLYAWPSMEIAARFDLDAFAVEWQSRDGALLYGIAFEPDRPAEIVALDVGTRTARRLGAVPGLHLRALALAGDTLAFTSYRYGGDLWLADGRGGRIVTHALGAREVARGGGHLLVSLQRAGHERITELDEAGHELRVLTNGTRDESPSILPGGKEFTFVRRLGAETGFYRCAFRGPCARVSDTILAYATVSPDGARVAYVDPVPQGPRARIVPLGGGPARDVGDAGSYCRPVWSSAHTLWISRRGEGTPEWVEIDVDPDPARATGRTLPGARDCSDGLPDPSAPTRDGVKIVVDWRSELRVHAVP